MDVISYLNSCQEEESSFQLLGVPPADSPHLSAPFGGCPSLREAALSPKSCSLHPQPYPWTSDAGS